MQTYIDAPIVHNFLNSENSMDKTVFINAGQVGVCLQMHVATITKITNAITINASRWGGGRRRRKKKKEKRVSLIIRKKKQKKKRNKEDKKEKRKSICKYKTYLFNINELFYSICFYFEGKNNFIEFAKACFATSS